MKSSTLGSTRPTATVLALVVLGVAMVGGSTIAQSPTDAVPSNERIPTVTLSGAFGTVAGAPVATDDPLPDPSALEPLDAYARGAGLRITVESGGDFGEWHATAFAEPALDADLAIDLGSGSGLGVVKLPDTGVYLVRVDGTVGPSGNPFGDPHWTGSWVWRVSVPDRPLPDDGDYPPMPAIRLSGIDTTIVLEPGSSCFVGTCGDIGFPTPPDLLPVIDAAAGSPLRMRLSDGSGMSGWSVSAEPAAGGGAADDQIQLAHDELGASRTTAIFPAPPSGDWVVLVSVRFDRERGHADGYARVTVPE